MELLNIFISSTYYDLKSERKILKKALEDLGHKPIMHEIDEIFYDPQDHTHMSCIKTVENEADLLIVIIGKRFGGEIIPDAISHLNLEAIKDQSSYEKFFSEHSKYSITQCEVLKAIEKGIPIFTFVEKEVWDARNKYEKLVKAGKSTIDYLFFENEKDNKSAHFIFDFISFINRLSRNNAIKPFNEVDEISQYMKKQLSAYLKEYLTGTVKLKQEEFELIPPKLPIEILADYFFDNFNKNRCIQHIRQKLDFNEKGDCEYTSEITVTPVDKITHYHYQVFTDKLGKVEVRDFYIRESPEECKYFGIKKGQHTQLNLFFKTPITDTDFTIILKLKLENYLSNLIDNREGYLHRRVRDKSKQFKAIHEIISFPNVPLFKTLKVQVTKHPEYSKTNSLIRPKVNGSKKSYEVAFKKADGSLFQVDTQLKFTLHTAR